MHVMELLFENQTVACAGFGLENWEVKIAKHQVLFYYKQLEYFTILDPVASCPDAPLYSDV